MLPSVAVFQLVNMIRLRYVLVNHAGHPPLR